MNDFEQREQMGEHVWTDVFSDPARVRLDLAVERWLYPWPGKSSADVEAEGKARRVDNYLRRFGLQLSPKAGNRHRTVLMYNVKSGPDDLLPSVIEAVLATALSSRLDDEVDLILREERLAYRLVNRQMIAFDSLELHEAVVSPTLRLLAGRSELADVEDAYQKALKEIGTDPADAITDAARALEAMLTAIGCEGGSLGAQLGHARRKNLLAPHDATLSAGITKIIDWVSADRSQKGDAHNAGSAFPEDAWLAVHVVGALIVRLAEGQRV
jgi:hypothetical protein